MEGFLEGSRHLNTSSWEDPSSPSHNGLHINGTTGQNHSEHPRPHPHSSAHTQVSGLCFLPALSGTYRESSVLKNKNENEIFLTSKAPEDAHCLHLHSDHAM